MTAFGDVALPVIENEGLLGSTLALFGLRDRSDELRPATGFEDLLGRLPVLVQFPVLRRAIIRRVENRVVKEGVGHGRYWLCCSSCHRRVVLFCFLITAWCCSESATAVALPIVESLGHTSCQ